MVIASGLLERLEFEAQALMDGFPPVWHDRNKRVVFEFACPPGCKHAGRVGYSRWRAMRPAAPIDVASSLARLEASEDLYDYPVASAADEVVWHVNFADPHLFVAYGSPLFAQDEMQVVEHPALGALREALVAQGSPVCTVEQGRPTPVLVTGVERRCCIATTPDATEGRPDGLYGNAFARAEPAAVRRATTVLDPPPLTNLIAMAAPHGGSGPYTALEIALAFSTAYTGFRAAVLESPRLVGRAARAVVHTGFWGCGAFGGNRVLMTMVQVLAVGAAGIATLRFHTVNEAGTRVLEEARGRLAEGWPAGAPLDAAELPERLAAMGFVWGVSDGN